MSEDPYTPQIAKTRKAVIENDTWQNYKADLATAGLAAVIVSPSGPLTSAVAFGLAAGATMLYTTIRENTERNKEAKIGNFYNTLAPLNLFDHGEQTSDSTTDYFNQINDQVSSMKNDRELNHHT
jgi:hypothetical protein